MLASQNLRSVNHPDDWRFQIRSTDINPLSGNVWRSHIVELFCPRSSFNDHLVMDPKSSLAGDDFEFGIRHQIPDQSDSMLLMNPVSSLENFFKVDLPPSPAQSHSDILPCDDSASKYVLKYQTSQDFAPKTTFEHSNTPSPEKIFHFNLPSIVTLPVYNQDQPIPSFSNNELPKTPKNMNRKPRRRTCGTIIPSTTSSTPMKSKYQCSECLATFSRLHDLKRHSYKHTGETPFTCEECCRGFNRLDVLRKHVLKHIVQ